MEKKKERNFMDYKWCNNSEGLWKQKKRERSEEGFKVKETDIGVKRDLWL